MESGMKKLLSLITLIVTLSLIPLSASGQQNEVQQRMDKKADEKIGQLEEPLYNPFVERYVLDELKQLRQEMADQRHDD